MAGSLGYSSLADLYVAFVMETIKTTFRTDIPLDYCLKHFY
jgi:hypothetical protein